MSRPILVLLAVFIVFGCVYAVTTPLFEASDELWHYPMVQHLSRGGALPVQDPNNVGPWRQEASQPPLYYYLMGWATAWIDTTDMPQVRWLNPHVDNGIITPDGNTNLAIHTAAEGWPWRGTVLAVRLVRLLSVLMSAGTVWFTYLLAREFFDDEISRLAAAGLVAFVPMFAFISGAVNNDNLASLLSSAILFLLVYLVRRPDWGWFRRFGSRASLAACLALGTLLGLAALTKQSALGLFPLAGLTLIAISLQPTADSRQSSVAGRWSSVVGQGSSPLLRHSSFILRHSTFLFLPALLIPSWWYIRNLTLYGDLLGWNGFIAILGRRAQPATLPQLWGERESFARSYWGLFGGVNVPMSDWIYLALNLVALAASLGLAFCLLRSLFNFFRPSAHPVILSPWHLVKRAIDSISIWFPHALLLGQLALLAYGLLQWATVTWSSQGRLVFSGIAAIAVLMTLGLRALLPASIRTMALAFTLVFMGAVTAAAPFAFIRPAYADPPPLTESQIAAIPHRLNVDFGAPTFPPEMRLLGYALAAPSAQPGDPITLILYWQSLAPMDRDWSVFIHLIDSEGIVVAQRDTYPGLGLMPTRKWEAGRTLADTYVIPIPATAYAPSPARIEIGLYDYGAGDRLLVVTEGLPDAGRDALTLTDFAITARPGPEPNPQAINFEDTIELIGYDMDRRTLSLSNSDSLTLTLYWRGLKPISRNYSVFAHVRGAGESLWAQHDSWPQDGAAPTSAWPVGETIVEARTLRLKPDTAPGVYDVEVGLYDEAGQRLQLRLPDGRLTDNFIYLSRIRVVP